METQKLNVALNFDKETRKKIVSALKPFKDQFDTKYIVDDELFIPHLTLYQNLFPAENQKEISKLVKKIASETKKFTIKFTRITNYRTSVWAQYQKTPEILALHKRVIEEIQPLRGDVIEEHFKKGHVFYERLGPVRQEMIEQYGHPFVGVVFDPHISLAKLYDRYDVHAIVHQLEEWDLDKIEVSQIALYESGEEGTAKRVLEEFKLK